MKNVFRGKIIVGNILMWGGFAIVLVGAYMPVFSDWRDNAYEKNLKISLGVALGGLVTELVGTFILQSGQEDIFNAVNLYNGHRINDYR